MIEFPTAKVGDRVTADVWNQARAAVRAMRLLQGEGVNLTWTANGVIISAKPAGNPWAHPFRCSLGGGNTASIQTGLVNGQEPLIKNVYLSGLKQDGVDPPMLDIGAKPQLGLDGSGYIALEFQCDDKWILIPKTLTVVQVAYYDSLKGDMPPAAEGAANTIGGIPGLPGRMVRCPLARMRQRDGGQIDLIQIPFFNLAHKADPRGDDLARHFFWPAPA